MSESIREGAYEDRNSLIVEHQDAIIGASDLIDNALHENLIVVDRVVRREVVISAVEMALRTETDTDDVHKLGHAILSVLSPFGPDDRDELKEDGASDELLRLITEWSSKYAAESRIPSIVENSGPDFWTDIRVESVKREASGTIGMNYQLIIGFDREVRLSMTQNSNLSLIYNLLLAQMDTVKTYGTESIEQLDEERLEELSEILNDLESLIEDPDQGVDEK